MIGVVIAFVLELAGAGYTLNYGITGSQVEIWLNDKFLTLIDQYEFDEGSKRTINIVQEWVSEVTLCFT